MAKSTILQLVNKARANLGEITPLTTLAGITGRSLMAFNKINEALRDIYSEYEGKWRFAEKVGSITLSSTSTAYTQPTDMATEDVYSFRSEDSEDNIGYLDPQEFDYQYNVVSETGMPTKFTRFNDSFLFNKKIGASEDGKIIKYRYWNIPTQFTTGTNTSTCNIPEIFEDGVLVNMATFKILSYEGDSESSRYAIEVWGRGEKEGSLLKMARQYKSVKLSKMRISYKGI